MTRRRLICLVLLVAAFGGGIGGCQRVLFKEGESRTQFDVYDRMHGNYVPTEEPDVFGRPQPALRARLSRQ
jgi:hypothetical protein